MRIEIIELNIVGDIAQQTTVVVDFPEPEPRVTLSGPAGIYESLDDLAAALGLDATLVEEAKAEGRAKYGAPNYRDPEYINMMLPPLEVLRGEQPATRKPGAPATAWENLPLRRFAEDFFAHEFPYLTRVNAAEIADRFMEKWAEWH